jgi:glutaconate CoA-transferase, subunit A
VSEIVSLDQLTEMVPGGIRLGIGGVHFSRLPMALIQRVLELGRSNFTFVSWGGGLPLELLLQAGAVEKLIFCFSSLDIFGLAPRFREALEEPSIEVEEWSALAMIQGLHAAQFNLPEMPFQLPAGSDLMQEGSFWKEAVSPFTGERIGQARRLGVDVLLLHAQRADPEGNIEIQGARGLDLSLLGAAKKTLVTVEEMVTARELGRAPRSFVLPHHFVSAVAVVPFGAYPASCLPYYVTDYRRMLAYVRQARGERSPVGSDPTSPPQKVHRFDCDDKRRRFLAQAAGVTVAHLTDSKLHRYGLRCKDDGGYTVDELLAVCLAREYDNSSICSVGSVSPLAMVSYLLAKRTHAPRLTLIALNGGFIDVEAHPMSLTLAETLEWQTAKACWGGDETYHWYYQPGRITHEVITVAQIDVRGRTNNAWIESGGRRIRLPGQGGMADVANLHKNFALYLTRHSPERFVEAVTYCTAARGLLTDAERIRSGLQPGRVRLISDLGIFELDHDKRRFRVVSLHPKVTLGQVLQGTAGELLIGDSLGVTEPPSKEQLHLIRGCIDPFGIRRLEFVPSKERLGLIEQILHAEEELVLEITEAASQTIKREEVETWLDH